MTSQNPPIAQRRSHRNEAHGVTWHDDWHWLRDPGYPDVQDQEILAYLKAENAYFEANMDLIGIDPLLNLYDEAWPIRTFQHQLPPPKFVFGSRGEPDRAGRAMDSIICQGTIVSGGLVERCVVGPRVRVNSYSHVADSILFEGVDIGRHAKVRRAIIDKGVKVPPGMEIGYDEELDRSRGLTISDSGFQPGASTAACT